MLIALVLGYHLQNFFSELRATAPLHTAQTQQPLPWPTSVPSSPAPTLVAVLHPPDRDTGRLFAKETVSSR